MRSPRSQPPAASRRKPKNLELKKTGMGIYAGIDEHRGNHEGRPFVYIGGDYYAGSAQIHLTYKKEIKKLAQWLTKVSEYLEDK